MGGDMVMGAGVMLTVSTMVIAVMISMMSVDLVTVTVVDTVVPDAGAMISVPVMVIAVLITVCYVPLIPNKLEVLELKLLPNQTKDLETTIDNPLNTKMVPVMDPVVDMVMVAIATISVSGMVIAVMISITYVELITTMVPVM